MKDVEIMMRVKLSQPTAPLDRESNEYNAWIDEIFRVKPQGYEVNWPRKGESWPVDSEGYSFIPLYITHDKDAHIYWMKRAISAEDRLKRIEDVMRDVLR